VPKSSPLTPTTLPIRERAGKFSMKNPPFANPFSSTPERLCLHLRPAGADWSPFCEETQAEFLLEFTMPSPSSLSRGVPPARPARYRTLAQRDGNHGPHTFLSRSRLCRHLALPSFLPDHRGCCSFFLRKTKSGFFPREAALSPPSHPRLPFPLHPARAERISLLEVGRQPFSVRFPPVLPLFAVSGDLSRWDVFLPM